MRIAHVITGLGLGGAERVLLDLSSQLVLHGHEVCVWSLSSDTSALSRGVDSRVQVFPLAVTKNPISWVAGAVRLVRGMLRFNPQVIHAHMFHALVASLAIKSVCPSTPLIFTSHSSEINGRLRRFIVRACRPVRDGDVIFRSDQHAELNASNVRVIPNGIRPIDFTGRSPLRGGSGRFRFISVGRFTEVKNHVALIRQFSSAVCEGMDAELWLVGDGPLRDQIEAEISLRHLDARVRLLGNRSDVMELLRDADMFVLASKWEGMPVALLEAGLLGLPVIATPVGAVPELLAGECGILAQSSELAEKMRAAVASWPASAELGVRLRRRVLSDYSLERMADSHVQLYSEVAQGKSLGGVTS